MALRKLTEEEIAQLNPEEIENISPMEMPSPEKKLRKLSPEEIQNIPPEELETAELLPTKVSPIFTKFSGMVGEAVSNIGKAVGLPGLEEFGETVKLGTKEMEERGMEAVGEVPGASELTGFFGGLTGERIFKTAPLPEEAGLARQATVGAARLLGMGVALTPVGRALRSAGLAAPVAGAITLGGYGALEKLPENASRLGHIATMMAYGAAFPLAGSALQKVASKVPEIGRVFSKIKAGEKLTTDEQAIQKAVEIGQSVTLGAAAGVAEGKTWEERVRNFFVGGLTFGLSHMATDAVGIAFNKSKSQKLPIGKKLNVEDAIKNPEVSPMERRLAAKVIYNRVNVKYSVNRELWDEYVREKINNNEPLDPLNFEKTLINKAQEVIREKKLLTFVPEEGVTYGKGFTMKEPTVEIEEPMKLLPKPEGIAYGEGFEMREPIEPKPKERLIFRSVVGEIGKRRIKTFTVNIPPELSEYGKVLQNMPEVKSRDQILRSYMELIKQKPEFLRTSEEKLLLKEFEKKPTEIDIEVIPSITPKKPITEEEILGKPKEISKEEIDKLRAIKKLKEMEAGKEPEKEILMEVKTLKEPELIRGKPKELPPTGKIYGETFISGEGIRIEKPEVSKILNKLEIVAEAGGYTGLVKSDTGKRVTVVSPTSSPENVKNTFIKNMSDPSYIQRLNEAWKIQGLTFNNLKLKPSAKIGDITIDEFKEKAKVGNRSVIEETKKVIVNIKTTEDYRKAEDLIRNTIVDAIPLPSEIPIKEERAKVIERIKSIEKPINDLLREKKESIVPEPGEIPIQDIEIKEKGGLVYGGLNVMQLKKIGRSVFNGGARELQSFRQGMKEILGKEYDTYTKKIDKITKIYMELNAESKVSPKPEETGYNIVERKFGNVEVETFQDQIKSNLKELYTDPIERFTSWFHRNIERAEDLIKGIPDKEKKELLDKMSANIGMGRHFMNKIKEWVKVPIWDAELVPVVQGIRKIWGHRESEIRHEFLERLRFLKGKPISQNMKDAIFNTTLTGKPTGYEKLNPIEREMVDKIFNTTNWMWKQFEFEMRKNAEDYRAIAKRAGFENIDDYITDYISKHSRPYYFPLMKGTGSYVVYAKAGGKTIWAENFESVIDAKKRASELMEQVPEAKVNMFDVRERYGGFRMPELIEMIHDFPYMRNILKDKKVAPELVSELEEILTGAYLKIWAKGRLAPREGIKGFSMDVTDVLNRYAETFPRSFVRRLNAKRIAKLIEQVPEDKQKYAKNLVDYYLGRQDYEGNINFAVRNIIFNWNLALKPSFAILNLTQRGTTTFWKAVNELGNEGAKITLRSQKKEINFYKEMAAGRMKGLRTLEIIEKSNLLSRTEKDIIKRLHESGELESLRNIEIIGKNKLSRMLNIMATLSEKSNRFHSALTGIEIGLKKGYRGEELFDYTTDFVHRTQWMYGKENRPIIGRGWRAMGFVFKTYILNDLNFMKDLYPNKKAFTGAVATRLALGGLGGIYGMGAITEAIDWAMIHIVDKKDWELQKEETKRLMQDKYGKAFVDIITRGLPSMLGIEGSITFGSPELFDIAGIPLVTGTWRNAKTILLERGIDWDEFIRRNVPTIVKHTMGFSTKTIFGKEKLLPSDIKRLPLEIRNRVMEIYKEMPKSLDGTEKLLYAMGFATRTPSDFYNALNAIKGAAREIKKEKAGFHREIGKALAEGRQDDMRNLLDDAKARGLKMNFSAIKRQLNVYRESEKEEEVEEE